MRYKVVPYRQGLEMQGWSIWDDEISPELVEQDVMPVMCSLDGEKPLLFRFMSSAYSWLAECERRGLDLEYGNVRVDVYDNGQGGGTVVLYESRSEGDPAVRDHPLAGPSS